MSVIDGRDVFAAAAMDGCMFAAVAPGEDGGMLVIGTCSVPAGAVAFAVSCGHPQARVVKVPRGVADAIADIIAAKCEDLSADENAVVQAACDRAFRSET